MPNNTAASPDSSAMTGWRHQVLNRILPILALAALAGALAFALNPERLHSSLAICLAAVHGTASLGLFILSALPTRRLEARGWVALVLLLPVGLVSIVTGEPSGIGPVYLVVLPVLATALMSTQAGWATLAVAALVVAAAPTLSHVQPISSWIGPAVSSRGLSTGLAVAAPWGLVAAALVLLLDQILKRRPVPADQLHDTGVVAASADDTSLRRAAQELAGAQLDLQTTSAELDALTRTVAHDLKNPLTSIMGFSTLLRENIDRFTPEQVNDSLMRIARGGNKMLQIIDELLFLGEIRDTASLFLQQLEMVKIVNGARLRVEDHRQAKQVELVVPKTWPQSCGHALWVEEIWVILITSAIKNSNSPLRIELGAQETPGDQVRFWVRDNGPGMSALELDQLRSDLSRPEGVRSAGYGLSLSVVKRIVQRHGGSVGVESSLDAGTCFFFTLPSAPCR